MNVIQKINLMQLKVNRIKSYLLVDEKETTLEK